MNINLLIELKNTYTELLLDILSPIIQEGIEHLYDQSKKSSDEVNVLKTFQKLLRDTISWNDKLITKEYNRIILNTKSNYPWFLDLVKAVIKSNISILTVNEIPKNIYEEINVLKFIHFIYIESAKKLWNDPFLFYHKYSPIDIKRNQRDSLRLIREAILNAIRRILPMKIILDKYLGDSKNDVEEFLFDIKTDGNTLKNIPLLLELDITDTVQNNNKENLVKVHRENINPIVLNSLNNNSHPINAINNMNNISHMNNSQGVVVNPENIDPVHLNTLQKNKRLSDKSYSKKNYSETHSARYSNKKSSNKTPSLNNKILELIDNNVPLSETNDIFQKNDHNNKNSNSSSTLKKIIDQSINKNAETKSLSLNSNIKNKIKNNLEKSVSNQETNKETNKNSEKYEDFFSNSDKNNGIIENETNLNTQDKNENKSRDKFFNNYLNF